MVSDHDPDEYEVSGRFPSIEEEQAEERDDGREPEEGWGEAGGPHSESAYNLRLTLARATAGRAGTSTALTSALHWAVAPVMEPFLCEHATAVLPLCSSLLYPDDGGFT